MGSFHPALSGKMARALSGNPNAFVIAVLDNGKAVAFPNKFYYRRGMGEAMPRLPYRDCQLIRPNLSGGYARAFADGYNAKG